MLEWIHNFRTHSMASVGESAKKHSLPSWNNGVCSAKIDKRYIKGWVSSILRPVHSLRSNLLSLWARLGWALLPLPQSRLPSLQVLSCLMLHQPSACSFCRHLIVSNQDTVKCFRCSGHFCAQVILYVSFILGWFQSLHFQWWSHLLSCHYCRHTGHKDLDKFSLSNLASFSHPLLAGPNTFIEHKCKHFKTDLPQTIFLKLLFIKQQNHQEQQPYFLFRL